MYYTVIISIYLKTYSYRLYTPYIIQDWEILISHSQTHTVSVMLLELCIIYQ